MQYLARFETDGGEECQGVVRFPAAPRLQTYYPDRWFAALARAGEASAGLRRCAVSLRASLRAGQLEQLAFFRVPAAAEHELRHYLASFLELLALVDGSVELPMNRAAHDAAVGLWASHVCGVAQPDFHAGPAWVACDFRLFDDLARLLANAAAAGHDLFYQVHLHPSVLTTEQERRARRNWVVLSGLRGVPPALLEHQSRLLHRPAGDVLLAEEYVGTATAEGAHWLAAELRRLFEARFGRMRLEAPEPRFLDGQGVHAEALEAGVHRAVMATLSDEAQQAAAVDAGTAGALFHWSGALRRWFEPPLAYQQSELRAAYEKREDAENAEASAVAARVASGPAITSRASDYAFVSYRRADFTRIEPLLGGLNAANLPFWFDRAIPGGSQWMGVLQERIANARSVLLFLSQSAADSRYVRMEINYAYSLGKPILPVRLERVQVSALPSGMGLLLNSLHVVDARLEAILDSLRQHGY